MKANMPWATPDALVKERPSVYKDTGCSLHSACLTCPFPVCRYDQPDFLRRAAARQHKPKEPSLDTAVS